MKTINFICCILCIVFFTACPTPQTSSQTTTSTAKIIDHTNFDCTGYSDAEINAAKALKVYFEHASTGQDIFGNSSSDSKTGGKFDGNGKCGLQLLYEANNRYLTKRDHFTSTESDNHWSQYKPTWFTTDAGKEGGLQTNRRDNPQSQKKASGFGNLPAETYNVIDVAMFKFCWVDCWPGADWENKSAPTTHDTGEKFANFVIAKTKDLQAKKTGLVIVYWTMPLQSNQSFKYRDDFNNRIRTYCKDNGKWLMDMADIQCHNGTSTIKKGGYEAADPAGVISDGGHLSDAGALKMAKAYWSLLVNIAKSKQ